MQPDQNSQCGLSVGYFIGSREGVSRRGLAHGSCGWVSRRVLALGFAQGSRAWFLRVGLALGLANSLYIIKNNI